MSSKKILFKSNETIKVSEDGSVEEGDCFTYETPFTIMRGLKKVNTVGNWPRSTFSKAMIKRNNSGLVAPVGLTIGT